MAPRPGSRFTYGSTEDLSSSRLLTQSRPPMSHPNGENACFTSEADVIVMDRRRSWGWARIAAACAVALGVATVSVHSSLYKKTGSSTTLAMNAHNERPNAKANVPAQDIIGRPRAETPPRLSFTALNFYHIRDGKPAQDYPWLKDIKLIEPYRETTLAVENPRPGYHYKWEVRNGGEDDEVHTSASGAEAIVILTKLEKNMVTILELDSDGAVVRRLDEPVMVKYVRREIRTLTDHEREELFDAMHKLWAVRVQGGNGREIYGAGYSDIWAINRLHYKAASPLVCDHFHDGLGFLTNHALITNTFEYSLQAVNPKLTLPYWDFTIETSSAGANDFDSTDAQSQTKTPLLQASWFGTRDPEDNMVKDSRWAHTPIPRMEDNNPGNVEPDVYSKLRAPWNVNDRAYLTRGLGKMCHADVDELYPWPTCSMHYELATEYESFYDWVWGSMYDPHGPVHIWIGGVLDCEDTYEEIADLVGKETAGDLALLSFVHRKNLFRDGFFSCEGSVDVSESPEEVLNAGVCGCQGFDLTQGDDFKTIISTMAFMDDYIGDMDDDIKRKVVELLCSSTVVDGDHLQASSSLDPSFWSTHPTMERLWMFSILTGRVTDFSWPDSDTEYSGSDGNTYSEKISIYTDSCEGHRGSDVFPYELLSSDANDFTVRTGITGNPADGGNIFTNREALAAFDARINSLPYVYDTFKWSHCEADGYNLDDAWMPRDIDASGVEAANPELAAGATGARASAGAQPHASARGGLTAGGRTVFEKGAPKFPMYSGLTKKLAKLREKKALKERDQ